MFEQTLSNATRKNLGLLGQEPQVKKFYLAGGTAAALQLGHRFSFDLDFFSQQEFSTRMLIEILEKMGKLDVEQRAENTLVGNLNKVKISFFTYKYPLLYKPEKFMGIQIASLPDIAAMKLDAIATRGRKRDFIDLYEICQQKYTLFETFDFLEKKYAGVNYNKIHLLKSLTYFVDAEGDEIPKMIKKISWSKVKEFFINEAKKVKESGWVNLL